jgi:hypothetical protein
MKAVERILAYDDGQIDQHRDATWQQRRDNARKGKPKPSNSLPDGTFKQTSPGGIANTLKNKSKDYDQAMRRLTNYENGRGRGIPNPERRKLDQAKDSLKNAFGESDDNDSNSTVKAFQTSINTVPVGHNLDDEWLETGLSSNPEQTPKADISDPMVIGAVTRLLEN